MLDHLFGLYPVQDGSTALYVAAQEGHLRVVEMLLKANADVNIKAKVRIAVHVHVPNRISVRIL